MPSKSLTLKFGADTSKLDRALKRLRTGMAKSLRGAGRRGIGIGGAAIGGALGGFAGGAFAGGATGMARGLFGELMDASPAFAQSMLNLGETVRRDLQPEMERLADTIVKATPAIARFIGEFIDGSARVIRIAMGEEKVSDPGYFTAAGAAAGTRAAFDFMRGDITGTGNGSTQMEAQIAGASLLAEVLRFTPAGGLLGISSESVTAGASVAQSAWQRDYEGIAPGSI